MSKNFSHVVEPFFSESTLRERFFRLKSQEQLKASGEQRLIKFDTAQN